MLSSKLATLKCTLVVQLMFTVEMRIDNKNNEIIL